MGQTVKGSNRGVSKGLLLMSGTLYKGGLGEIERVVLSTYLKKNCTLISSKFLNLYFRTLLCFPLTSYNNIQPWVYSFYAVFHLLWGFLM